MKSVYSRSLQLVMKSPLEHSLMKSPLEHSCLESTVAEFENKLLSCTSSETDGNV